MKQNKTKIIALIVLIIVVGVIFFISKKSEAPVVNEMPITPETPVTPDVSDTKISTDDIVIDSPTSGQAISSGTLTVSGKARGNWFFEASAPFEIQDNNKNTIETAPISAQGDWMTTDFVPFTGKITFTVPPGVKNGFVVFRNDNPSGDPAKDKSVSVPVVFK